MKKIFTCDNAGALVVGVVIMLITLYVAQRWDWYGMP